MVIQEKDEKGLNSQCSQHTLLTSLQSSWNILILTNIEDTCMNIHPFTFENKLRETWKKINIKTYNVRQMNPVRPKW